MSEQETLTCDRAGKRCEGPVEHRLYDNGTRLKTATLCEHHFDERLRAVDRALEYMSPSRPSWFDEGYAGERWDDDY